jgi:imidazolonepropionase-like amidohydrolase
MRRLKDFRVLLLPLFIFFTAYLYGQAHFPYDLIYKERPGRYLLVNAMLVTDYQSNPQKADILVDKGLIVKTGNLAGTVKDAVVVDLQGMYVYPSFIDLFTQYGLPESTRKPTPQAPQYASSTKGAYSWNEAFRPETEAHQLFESNASQAKPYLESGFGTVLAHQMDGIARGSGALTLLGDGNPHKQIILPRASQHISFRKGTSTQAGPASLMGTIALLRQTYLDKEWMEKNPKDAGIDLSLLKWNDKSLPQIFEVDDWQSLLRADKIGDEFGVRYIIRSAGDEYKRIDAIKAASVPLIVPIMFPKALDVEDPCDARAASFEDLTHWEWAPFNLRILQDSGIEFAITAQGSGKDFFKNLQTAIQHGLDPADALKALTATPAKLMGVQDKTGALRPGMLANMIIVSKPFWENGATLHQNWVNGSPNELAPMPLVGIEGKYELQTGNETHAVTISRKGDRYQSSLQWNDTLKVDVDWRLNKDLVTFSYKRPGADMEAGLVRYSGWKAGKDFSGNGVRPNGSTFAWTLTYSDTVLVSRDTAITNVPKALPATLRYPFSPYGRTAAHLAKKVLFRNATVWTNEADGILEQTDVLIENGKIVQVGKNLSAAGAEVVDATGKHLTSGIIDEHSHIAINGGVNEGTQASTAEVRIGDVINSEDVNIYRQLAGGVTGIQQLHGSANPIGGQSALIKLRWGALPEQMKIAGAPGFIKFALGENVKQSNWGGQYNTRFPQSRMGVEQVFVDLFTRAKEYMQPGQKRRDLELEALGEILQQKRFISCHSYVQSEVNMMMKVAEQFGFRVNTFTHILEGYKVSDIMKEHGVGASSFADWWAIKYELYDAIPYNPSLLNEVGVLTAINSDDAEMGRRLNQEAAKAVKYGGTSEEEAWKMVTLNPAKLLRIDNRTGSIKAGKDADLVLWSHHPLSVYARVEQTYVDGIRYFDKTEDEAMRKTIVAERERLIQLMLAEKKKGAYTEKVQEKKDKMYHCDDFENWEEEWHDH